MGIEEEETIEQAAAARRERLKALRAAQQLLENPEDDETQANEAQNGDDENNDPNVKFCNYLPRDKRLQEGKLAPPESPKFEDPVAAEPRVGEKKEVCSDNENVGNEEEETIEQAVAARRERLKALKAAQQLLENPEDDETQVNEDQNGDDENNDPSVKFRNYLPRDKQLQEGKLAPPELSKFEDPVAAEPIVGEKKEDPFLNIAPKIRNWDLKRDVQKRLDKLKNRTQKALYQLKQQEEERRLAERDDKGNDSGWELEKFFKVN